MLYSLWQEERNKTIYLEQNSLKIVNFEDSTKHKIFSGADISYNSDKYIY